MVTHRDRSAISHTAQKPDKMGVWAQRHGTLLRQTMSQEPQMLQFSFLQKLLTDVEELTRQTHKGSVNPVWVVTTFASFKLKNKYA